MAYISKQHDQSDCGAACLGFVAAHYRKVLPIAQLRLEPKSFSRHVPGSIRNNPIKT